MTTASYPRRQHPLDEVSPHADGMLMQHFVNQWRGGDLVVGDGYGGVQQLLGLLGSLSIVVVQRGQGRSSVDALAQAQMEGEAYGRVYGIV